MRLKFPASGPRTSVNAYGPCTPGHPLHVEQYPPGLLCILPALCSTGFESSGRSVRFI
jgi:hypothetical protein